MAGDRSLYGVIDEKQVFLLLVVWSCMSQSVGLLSVAGCSLNFAGRRDVLASRTSSGSR